MERQKNTNSGVKIIEVCKVAPPPILSSESDSPKSLPLSFFDLRWLKYPPIQSLLFYELPTLDAKTTPSLLSSFHSDILPRLKHSLSLTLHHYLPLAGNLTWPESSDKPVINYVESDCDAVTLVVAESDADFYRLSGTNYEDVIKSAEYHPLVPDLIMSRERTGLLALQVTTFRDGGFSIGITTHHVVLDGSTVITFLKSWAHTCRSLGSGQSYYNYSLVVPDLPLELKPFYDRSVIKDPAGLENLYLKQWLDLDGRSNRSLVCFELKQVFPDSVRGVFHLTRADIQKLRQSVNQYYSGDDGDHVHASTFSVTYAYVVLCLVKAEGLTKNDDEILVVFGMDCRSRLDPPLPNTYFGNCLVGCRVVTKTKSLVVDDDNCRSGLAAATKIISDGIKNLETNGVLKGAEKWLAIVTPSNFHPASVARIYSISGSPRFGFYSGTDFGWGRPRKFDIVSLDWSGSISLSDSRDGNGGVEIGLALSKQHMETFASLFAQGLE
ncbi:Transferase [Parasponia andersonii]|uniref:Transferase n=1 Tax=Parasponia andersonii TaxID=3476 RepID=A0A2P5BV87_PARAD|nr:Transferase [Parasponia andersonii]